MFNSIDFSSVFNKFNDSSSVLRYGCSAGFFAGIAQGIITARYLRAGGHDNDQIASASVVYIIVALWLVAVDLTINRKLSDFGLIGMLTLLGSALGQFGNAIFYDDSNNRNTSSQFTSVVIQ